MMLSCAYELIGNVAISPCFPQVGAIGDLFILVLTDCILKLLVFNVITEIFQASSKNGVLIQKKKATEEPNNVKLFCTVHAQILHHFQIQYFTFLRALHFRSEWGVLGTCTVGQFRLPRWCWGNEEHSTLCAVRAL